MHVTTICELASIPLIVFCTWIAYSRREVPLLFFLFFDAWFFEWVITLLLKDLNYSKSFHLNMLGIPAVIIFGWVSLLYPCLTLFKPVKNTLLKACVIAWVLTSIDLVMDAVGVHYGLWEWNQKKGYFGIPYNNFFGWFVYSFLVSLSISLFYNSSGRMAYLKMVFFITVAGLALGGGWYILPAYLQQWLFWIIYIIAGLYMLENLKLIEVTRKYPLITIPASFLFVSFTGILISFKSYPGLYLLFSFFWTGILILIAIKLYRHKNYNGNESNGSEFNFA